MANDERQKYSFDEYPSIMRQIDDLAEREGTTRTALIRRGLRMVLSSLPDIPTSGNLPPKKAETT